MTQLPISAHTALAGTAEAAEHLASQIAAADPRVIVFFCSAAHDGAALSGALRGRFPRAEVIGCTTAGEFIERARGETGVSAMALGADRVTSCATRLARFGTGVYPAVQHAADEIGRDLGVELRAADPSRYVGVVLVEGLRGREEAANHALGIAAPSLEFVGGSAGDNLAFKSTRVFRNGEESDDGAALLVMEMAVPFVVAMTCSFEPSDSFFTITRADAPNRIVYEVDGRPVLEAYAEAAGVEPGKLDTRVFMRQPWGMMLDEEAWIRSPQQALPDGGLKFYCEIEEGMGLHIMRGTDLVGETEAALRRAAAEVGGRIGGALVFNCILRRLELDAEDAHEPFLRVFSGFPAAGFHTYGESYLGHINQTCTGLVFA